jgi:CobQ-like glutamine amidotransferase family enzyme
MDSDDIMFSTRIQKQIHYMAENPQVVCCGGQLIQFTENNNNDKITGKITNHPLIITQEHCEKLNWFMNHPTLCYRKWAIEEIGGYGIGRNLREDRELEVKLLNCFGEGSVCNLPNILIMYRIHSGKLSYNS